MKQSKKQLVALWMLIFALPLALWAAFPVFADLHASGSQNRFEQLTKEAEALKLPLTPNQLGAIPSVSDEENAAPLLIPILQALETHSDDVKASIEGLRAALPGEEVNLSAPVAQALRESSKLQSKPGLNFGRDFRLGSAVLQPELGQVKRLVTLLYLRAIMYSQRGQDDLALSDLTSAMHVARLMRTDVSHLGSLTSMALENLVNRAICELASSGRGDLTALERLKKVSAHPDLPSLQATLEFETGFLFNAVRVDAGFGESDLRQKLPGLHALVASTVLDDGLRALRLVKEDPQGDLETIGEKIDQQSDNRRNSLRFRSSLAMGDLLTSYGEFGAAVMRTEAQINLVRACLDILIFEARHKEVPSNLSVLGSDYLDSFANKPIGYRRTSEGFRVWSVGIDRVDNGGLRADEINPASGSPEPTGDIVEEFPRPPRKRNEPAAGLPSK